MTIVLVSVLFGFEGGCVRKFVPYFSTIYSTRFCIACLPYLLFCYFTVYYWYDSGNERNNKENTPLFRHVKLNLILFLVSHIWRERVIGKMFSTVYLTHHKLPTFMNVK